MEAIVFDWGGVLHEYRIEAWLEGIAQDSGVELEELEKVEVEQRKRADYGELEAVEYMEKVLQKMDIDADAEELLENLYENHVSFNEGVWEIAQGLKDQGYKLILLSNNNEGCRKYMDKPEGFEDLFDKVVLSYEKGVKKPDFRFYQMALEGLDVSSDECVYIDDREAYLEAARQLGFKTLKFESAEQLRDDLNALGIEV